MNRSKPAIPRSAAAVAAAWLLAAPVGSAHENHGENGRAAGPTARQQQPWGIAGDARKARRTLEIVMGDDMRFSPSAIEVRQGDTVRFVLRNRGKLMHEMVIGTPQALREHAALMRRFPNMEHEEPHMAHVAPGRSGELAWTFNRPGEFEFACLIPGHFEAGMKGTIKVAASPASAVSPVADQRPPAAAAGYSEGEVIRLDPAAGRITLKHGEIGNLGMPPMTMGFGVTDKRLLEQVKVGDKVRFRAADLDGRLTVTEIRPAK